MIPSVSTRQTPCKVFAICAVLGSAMIAPCSIRAEGFFDLYGGVTLGQSAEADHRFFGDPATFPPPAPITTTKGLDFSATGTVGIRGGYWFEPLPWLGLAADLSYFERQGSGAEIDLVPLSFLVMLREPMLASESFPKGRLQPYVGIGPGFFYSHTSVEFAPPFQNVNHGSFFGDVGLDARVGTLWRISKAIGVFLEYRFTHVSLDYEKKECRPRSFAEALSLVCAFGENPPEVTISTTETTLNTHHILMGIRF